MDKDFHQLVSAFREALKDDDPNAWLLVRRIPVICQDVREIKNTLIIMKDTLENKLVAKSEFSPIRLIVYGAVMMILIAVFGALLLSVIPHATIAVR